MVAKGFGRRLLVVLSIVGGLGVLGLLDYLVCVGFKLIPSDASKGQIVLIYLIVSPIITSMLLLAVCFVLYPIVNLVLATVTYLVNGEVLTLGRIRERIEERIRTRETEAHKEKVKERERIEERKKLMARDYEEALKELDKEFPGIKVENEITRYPFAELGRKGNRK